MVMTCEEPVPQVTDLRGSNWTAHYNTAAAPDIAGTRQVPSRRESSWDFSRQVSCACARRGIYGYAFTIEATAIESPACTILPTWASVATRFLAWWRDSS
jgi:hypothetical protein